MYFVCVLLPLTACRARQGMPRAAIDNKADVPGCTGAETLSPYDFGLSC
jgi:hypothetical protein